MENDKVEESRVQKIESYLSIVCNFFSIVQLIFSAIYFLGSLFLIKVNVKFDLNTGNDKNLVWIIIAGVLVVYVVISIFFIRWQRKRGKKDLEKLMDRRLAEKNQQIDELNKRISVCKNVIKRLLEVIEEYDEKITTLDEENKKKMTVDEENKKKLTPVQYYLIDKDLYDDFKTELKILECLLEVELVKCGKNNDKYGLSFKWDLKVENPTSKPTREARFIYSGIEGNDIRPVVTVKEAGLEKTKIKREIKVLGDDCFIEICFKNELMGGKQDEIVIAYTVEYDFNRKCDWIWLVPDALGFASMDRFCIRFYSDGDIINEETRAELKYYELDKEYKTETEYSMIEYKEFDNGKKGFEAQSGSEEMLHGHGYVLELRNEDN